MTFEQWFNMQIDLSDCEVVRVEEVFFIAKAAWQAGYVDGVEAMGGPVIDPLAGLPGISDYTYGEFSKDCDRW